MSGPWEKYQQQGPQQQGPWSRYKTIIRDQPIPQEKPTRVERIGRGAQDVIDRIAQLTVAGGEKLGLKGFPEGLGDVMTQQMNEENALYERGRGKDAGIDLARIAGNAGMQAPLALIPGGKETALARAGVGALQGAASGFLQFDPTNSLKGTAKNTGLGAATGAVVAPIAGYVGDKVGQGIRVLIGRLRGLGRAVDPSDVAAMINQVPELADVPEAAKRDLVQEAIKQIKTTGALDTDQLGRKANLIAQGLKPTKSMVTRNPADWTLERNLQKLAQSPDDQLSSIGQELTSVYQSNDAALANRLGSFTKGLPQGTQEAHGMAVMQSLDDLSNATQKQVGELYEKVRQVKGNELASDARQLAATLDDLRDNTYAEKLVSSVTNKLRRFGMLDMDGALTAKSLTVSQAEELRKFVNKLPNDFGKSDIIKAIDSDVLSGLGEDAFSGARGAASQRFALLGNPSTQRALNTLGELNQGKTAQNFIKSQIIGGADQDVAALVNTLSKLPKEQAADAMNSLRAGVMQHLQQKAINPNSGQFSGAALNRALTEIGDEKLIRIFGPEQAIQIKNLARAAVDSTYQPAYSAVNNSNTAPMLMSLMQKGRAIAGVNLPFGLNDTAVQMAARSGYRSQLSDALAAKSSGQLRQLSPRMRELIRVLSQSGTPTGVAALNQARKSSDEKPKDRQ